MRISLIPHFKSKTGMPIKFVESEFEWQQLTAGCSLSTKGIVCVPFTLLGDTNKYELGFDRFMRSTLQLGISRNTLVCLTVVASFRAIQNLSSLSILQRLDSMLRSSLLVLLVWLKDAQATFSQV